MKILGNQKHISHMKEAAKRGRLPHAYILHGAAGSGKKTFAEYMAAALLCEAGLQDGPCGACPSCIKAGTHNHPDIIRVMHEKPTVLSVQEVRDQVVNTVNTAPYYGPYKIYIISDAQLLNDHGQNALLKTIEEPPEYVILFLLTDNADAFLDTIRSRCIRIDMEAVSQQEIEEMLMAEGTSPGEAKAFAAFAGGNPGIAKQLAEDEDVRSFRDETTTVLKKLRGLDALEIYEFSAQQDKTSALRLLDIMRKWYRDLLLVKTGAEQFGLYFAADASVLHRQAQELSFEALARIPERIEDAQTRIYAGVKAEAAIETLLLKIREEYQ